MTLIVLGEAEEEFAKSVQYYESKEVPDGSARQYCRIRFLSLE
jgi:hypothetical protein